MSRSHRSSSASATCRIEWRPSRLIGHWLAALAVLAPVCLLYSALPRPLAWLMAVPACALALRARHRYRRAPAHCLRVCADGPLEVDGRRMPDWRLRWRAGLAFLEWRDGGQRRALSFWPDTLDARTRRELRLATPAAAGTWLAAGMAP